MSSAQKHPTGMVIRQLDGADVAEAGQIVRLAFGTFMGLPDPTQAFGDRDVLSSRWRWNHEGVLGAYLDGKLVGSNVATRWGTFGFFGPLTIRPDLWDRGIAQRLLEPTMEKFAGWGTTQEGLFTFPNSPKHLALYEKFGFNARFLTPVLQKKVAAPAATSGSRRFSELSSGSARERHELLSELRALTGGIYDGLDLTDEINSVANLGLGDTILLRDGSRTVGLAICHTGPGTEGGSGNCYIKFGAVSSGSSGTEARFADLLSAVEGYAAGRNLATVEAGVNMGRRGAYKRMLECGFRTAFVGVAMQRPDEQGFNRPDVFAVDDWR